MKEYSLALPRNGSRADGSIPVTAPTLPGVEDVLSLVRESYESGIVTCGPLVGRLEDAVKRFVNVKHVVAVSSCTSGLMLVFSAMAFPEKAEVIVPSFTFAATVQALVWNRLVPVYVDCLPGTMTVDPREVRRAVTRKTAAICPVTVFGLPPDLEHLEDISKQYGLPLISDSAQGLGATYAGRRTGAFGLCEVFSLSPGKVITALEGGLVTTDDSALAAKVRAMRDYGKGPDGHEILYQGLSSRLVEFNAAVGLLNIQRSNELLSRRLHLTQRYRERLSHLNGCSFQEIPDDRTTNGSIFVLFARDGSRVRDALFEELKNHKIQSRKYFFPPAHAHGVFRGVPHRIVGELRVTRSCASSCLALPLYSHMADETIDRVCNVLESVLNGAR
ncbi:MAG: DegT/DnrJ/EryC1/StrS family aminotransferase [Thermodesulfobacteriota bacterium]